MLYLLDGSSGIQFVRNYTGASNTDVSDADITFYLEGAEAEVFESTGVKFYETEVVEKYDGTDNHYLWLKNSPVKSVSCIMIDSVRYTGEIKIYDTNRIYIQDAIFPGPIDKHYMEDQTGAVLNNDNKQNIVVTYKYGQLQADNANEFTLATKLALYLASADVFAQLASSIGGGITSEQLDNYSINFSAGGAYSSDVRRTQDKIDKIYKIIGTRSIVGVV